MATSHATGFPWTGIDPAEWLRTWQQVWRLAPESLVQPILPGWTLNINSHNSSAPQTEVEVLARHSYGRQIGRIADALEALIQERAGRKADTRAFDAFLDLKKQIDAVKRDSAAVRVEAMARDVAFLREALDPVAFERLRNLLRDAMK